MMPRDATNSTSGNIARSLAYVRKGGPLLMRACRCVSERRSRASTEVIGQYQSQPRDNHSPAMRLTDAWVRACMRACMRAWTQACVIVAKLIISRGTLVAVGRIPSKFAIFRERQRGGREEGGRRNQVCIRFTEDSLRRKRERRLVPALPGSSKFPSLNRGFDGLLTAPETVTIAAVW